MKKILILAGRYLPGYRDGGPLRTLINLVDNLGDEYEFHIACYDRDHGDDKAYEGISYDCWSKVGKAKVWYVRPKGFNRELLLKLSRGMDHIYLTSFYEEYGYNTLFLLKERKINIPVTIASMGVFAEDAMAKKALKKKAFIKAMKLRGLFDNVTWSVTSELEAVDVKRVLGNDISYVVAEDMPRSSVFERKSKEDDIFRICFVSRICEHKGLDVLIDALKDISDDRVSLSIAGPVDEKEYWDECVKGLKDIKGLNWEYEGEIPTDNIPEYLSNMDIMVLPSKSENYGHIIFEAMASGCIPVISDNTPWSYIGPMEAGIVCERTAKGIRDGIDTILKKDADSLNDMSALCYKAAKEKIAASIKDTGYRKIFG